MKAWFISGPFVNFSLVLQYDVPHVAWLHILCSFAWTLSTLDPRVRYAGPALWSTASRRARRAARPSLPSPISSCPKVFPLDDVAIKNARYTTPPLAYLARLAHLLCPVVGLTGGIATGKSTVSAQLKSFGIPIVDADLIARQVVEPGTPALKAIVAHFGEDILLPDGYLNRPKLGSIVFNDEAQRKKLNGIVHPAVWRAMFYAVVGYWVRGHNVCILDTPLLIEGGLWKWMGKVVVVYWYALLLSRDILRVYAD